MKSRLPSVLLALFAGCVAIAGVVPEAVAQQNPANAQQGDPLAQLPPALRAAVLAGNANAVTQTINSLSGGDPARMAALANSAIAAAERMLATSPQAAVAVAGAAVQVVRAANVQSGAPAESLSVVTTAARILIQPEAQRVAPQAVANLATAVTAVVSSPAIYSSSPQAAIGVMANAYSAATSAPVLAAAPQVQAEVAGSLRQASQNTTLNLVNPTNVASIDLILRQINPVTGKEFRETTGTTTTGNQTQNTQPDVNRGSPS